MRGSRWVVALVAVVVVAVACDSGSEPGAEAQSVPVAAVTSVGSERVGGLGAALDRGVDVSVAPLGDYDRSRVVAAAAMLDSGVECPPDAVPASLDDVVEVLRVEGGCALVEYVALGGRSVVEVRREILGSDPAAYAVGVPPRDLVLADYDSAPPPEYDGDEYEAGDWWYLDLLGASLLWESDGWEYTASDGSAQRVRGWAEEVTVAVLDSGTFDHRDLAGRFADTAGDAWLSLACHHDGSNPHGTHVAGLIAANPSNGWDAAGIAPQAEILPIHHVNENQNAKCLPNAADLDTAAGENSGSLTATQAVRLAAQAGADIVNMSFSWGFVGRSSPVSRLDDGSDAFEAMIDLMKATYGTIFVAAAGNCGNPDDFVNTTTTDSCPDGLDTESYPAAYQYVFSVAASNRDSEQAVFSTSNQYVLAAMPGDGATDYSGLLSTVPLLACQSDDTDGDGTDDEWSPLGCGDSAAPQACDTSTPRRRSTYDTPAACAHRAAHFQGTSMAAPLMSGAVAHILARYPEATAEQIVEALLDTTVNPNTGRTRTEDDDLGLGIVNPVALLERLDEIIRRSLPGEPPTTIPNVGTEPDPTDPEPVDTDTTAETFTAVSAGHSHSCGVRSDGTITCWGNNDYGQADPPTGTFTAVSAGETNSCGLRTDGTVTCWGNGNKAPAGSFTAVVTSLSDQRFLSNGLIWGYSCGLRTDGTVTCWDGSSRDSFDSIFDSSYSAISAGGMLCLLRTDGTVTCWEPNFAVHLGLDAWGSFTAISTGSPSCGLRTNGTVTCWAVSEGSVQGEWVAPSGSFTALSAGSRGCGLRTDGTAVCWGWTHADANRSFFEHSDTPAGSFAAISAGGWQTCGLRNDGTVTCWGDNETG